MVDFYTLKFFPRPPIFEKVFPPVQVVSTSTMVYMSMHTGQYLPLHGLHNGNVLNLQIYMPSWSWVILQGLLSPIARKRIKNTERKGFNAKWKHLFKDGCLGKNLSTEKMT